MAKTSCPEWLFNLSVARTAHEFIISDMPIKAYAKKYSKGLSEKYDLIKFEEIETEAELLLRFLVEINADNADELINYFSYFILKYENGMKRKMKGLFGTAFDPVREKTFVQQATLKLFRAFVFGLRSGVSHKPSEGWDIKDEEELDFFLDIIKKEADIVDAL